MTRVLLLVLLVLAVACSKSADKSGDTKTGDTKTGDTKTGDTKTGDTKTVDTKSAVGAGGEGATHSASSGGGQLPDFKLHALDPTDSSDIATLKERTQRLVSKWLSEQTTSDGFIVTYEMPRNENVQDDQTLKVETKQVGVYYGVYVRRVIDGQAYKCTSTHIDKQDDVQRVVDACKTAKPAP